MVLLEKDPSLIASLVGRGARFLTLGALVYLFGGQVQGFVVANFGMITAALGSVVVVLVVLLAYIRRRR